MRYYTYFNKSEINLVNWDWVYESSDTVRWDNVQEHFIISFDDEYVEVFERFNGIKPMNLQEIHTLINTSDWIVIDPDLE